MDVDLRKAAMRTQPVKPAAVQRTMSIPLRKKDHVHAAGDSPARFSGYEKPPAADIRPGSETSRSSSPATDSSHCYPPSTSSCSTSADCSCPRDEHYDSCAERCGSRRWEGDSPIPREASPVLGADEMPTRSSSTRPSSRMALLAPSRLRNTVAVSSEHQFDSDGTGSRLGGDEFEDDDDDDEWSGENDSLDGTVIAAVNGDLALAAFLIPLLHRAARSSVRNKVESWQCYQAARDGGESAAGDQLSGSGEDGSPSNQRKRRKRSGSEDGDGSGDGDNGGGGGGDGSGGAGNMDGRPAPPSSHESPNLACPFHKLNPFKYRTQHTVSGGAKKDYYRACMGPGFKNIQRLKEHLKRKHYPVQCGRCYLIFKFPPTDRTKGINQLDQHLQQAEPCERGDPILQEGISDQQWAELEKQNRKKNQEVHKVEKWFEIWRVLFPRAKEPETPWYADAEPGSPLPSSSNDSETFASIFRAMLSYRVQQGDINLPDGQENTTERLTHLATQAFNLYRSVHGSAPRTETSSSNTGTRNQLSVLGGSSTLPSVPTNASSMSRPLTATTAFSSATTLQQQQHPHAQPHHPQYTLNSGTGGIQYGLAAIPMGRQTGQLNHPQQYQQLMAATNFNPAMPAPDDLPVSMNSYYVPLVFPAGIPYPQVTHSMPAAHFSPAQLQPPEFYSQTEGFGTGQEGEFGGQMNLQ